VAQLNETVLEAIRRLKTVGGWQVRRVYWRMSLEGCVMYVVSDKRPQRVVSSGIGYLSGSTSFESEEDMLDVIRESGLDFQIYGEALCCKP
jgi:hypothetical protein